jgi:hypothetical protein
LFSYKIAVFLKLNLKTKILFFSALYIILPILKKFTYLPVNTDITAYTIGIASLYYFLKKNKFGLTILWVLGSFAFPSMIYSGALLVMFSESKDRIVFFDKYQFIITRSITILLVGLFVLGVAWITNTDYRSAANSQTLHHKYLFFSFTLMLIYLYRLFRYMDYTNALGLLINKKHIVWIVFATTIFILIKLTIKQLGYYSLVNVNSSETYLKAILYGSIVNPLTSLVGHVAFYGPMLLLVVIFWKGISKEINRLGISYFTFICLFFILSIGRESRQFINAWPFLVLPTIIYLNKKDFSWRFIILLVVLSFVYSKFWFQINLPEMHIKNGLLRNPAQRFFMMNGAYMSYKTYNLHIIIELLTYCLIMVALYFEKPGKEVFYKLKKYVSQE